MVCYWVVSDESFFHPSMSRLMYQTLLSSKPIAECAHTHADAFDQFEVCVRFSTIVLDQSDASTICSFELR